LPFGTLLIVASSSVQSALYQVSVRQATISLSLLLPATSRWSGLGVAIRFAGNYALWDFHPRFGTCPSYYGKGAPFRSAFVHACIADRFRRQNSRKEIYSFPGSRFSRRQSFQTCVCSSAKRKTCVSPPHGTKTKGSFPGKPQSVIKKSDRLLPEYRRPPLHR